MKRLKSPYLIYVCGCNGAGKSTLTKTIRSLMPSLYIVDPDKISKDKTLTTIQTGKFVSALINRLISQQRSFLKESTLSSVFDFRLLEKAKSLGYHTRLCYICLENVELAYLRVKSRVASGGHSVPFEDIERRYKKGLENLPKAIKAFDSSIIMDNSSSKYENVAIFQHGEMSHYYRIPGWFLGCHHNLNLPTPPVTEQSKTESLRPTL